MNPTALQSLTKNLIQNLGQTQVTVTRRAAIQGGSTTSQTLYCLAQPISYADAEALQVEGILNVGDGNQYQFIFGGDEDVAEATDKITFQNQIWRILTINPQFVGATQALHCICVREAGT